MLHSRRFTNVFTCFCDLIGSLATLLSNSLSFIVTLAASIVTLGGTLFGIVMSTICVGVSIAGILVPVALLVAPFIIIALILM